MAAGSKQIPPEDTLANLLLTLTALSGEFPTAQISRLPSTGAYQEKILKSLKGEKLLRTYYRDGLRALRLTTAAKSCWRTSGRIGSCPISPAVPRQMC